MKKNRDSREVASLRRSSFRVGPGDLGSDALLEQFLSQIVGGIDPIVSSCTAFTCNLYAPPPPPQVV
jgi:hypothetical protein